MNFSFSTWKELRSLADWKPRAFLDSSENKVSWQKPQCHLERPVFLYCIFWKKKKWSSWRDSSKYFLVNIHQRWLSHCVTSGALVSCCLHTIVSSMMQGFMTGQRWQLPPLSTADRIFSLLLSSNCEGNASLMGTHPVATPNGSDIHW